MSTPPSRGTKQRKSQNCGKAAFGTVTYRLTGIVQIVGANIKESLKNINFCRYLIDDTRAIFMFKDGSVAWEAKDFLVAQEGCKEVTIENKNYPGLKQVNKYLKIKQYLLVNTAQVLKI
jgi:Chaperone for wingless signalling and trafficking of LDL receptor